MRNPTYNISVFIDMFGATLRISNKNVIDSITFYSDALITEQILHERLNMGAMLRINNINVNQWFTNRTLVILNEAVGWVERSRNQT